jgi:hypothetical protein
VLVESAASGVGIEGSIGGHVGKSAGPPLTRQAFQELPARGSGFSDGPVLPRTVNDVRRALLTMVQPVAPSRATVGSERQLSLGRDRIVLPARTGKVWCPLA